MKRIVGLLLLGVCLFMMGAGEYRTYNDDRQIVINTDTTSATGGDSTRYDSTFYVGPTYGFKSLKARLILNKGASQHGTGSGNSGEDDSGWVWLYSHFDGVLTLLDSVVKADIPCTLITWLADDVGDSVLGDGLAIKWEIYDSIGDTLGVNLIGKNNYSLHYKILLK